MSDGLTPDEEKACLRLARQALEHFFKTGSGLRTPVKTGPLKETRGAFVTLTVDGDLRGCVGYPLPVKPLDETVIEMAVAAASQDTRVEPLSRQEMARLRVEISVLGLPRPVGAPEEVEVARHGIMGFNNLQNPNTGVTGTTIGGSQVRGTMAGALGHTGYTTGQVETQSTFPQTLGVNLPASTINGVNLRENILPTRTRADLILEKATDHVVRRVHLRKI